MSADSSTPPPPPPPPRRGRLPSWHREEDDGDWQKSRENVLSTLARLDAQSGEHGKQLQKIQISLAVLTTRVGLYAAGIAALITGIIEVAAALLRK